MKMAKQLAAAFVLLPTFDLFACTAGQYCNDFVSPLILPTDGSRPGTIQIPTTGYKYKSNQFCEWTIETDHPDYCIQFEVTRCTLEGKDFEGNCNSDYVDLFDYVKEELNLIGRFCGLDQGKSYKTSGSKMIVRFYSDSNLEYSGFIASYQAVPVDTSAENEQKKLILGLAVGIPVSVIVLAIVVTIFTCIVRHHKRKQAAACVASFSETNSQNHAYSNSGFSEGNQPPSLSHYDHMYNGNTDLNIYSTSTSQSMVFLRPFQEDSEHFPQTRCPDVRSCSPPPAYESLFISEGRQNRISISLPSYEDAVKYNINYSTV